MHAVSTNQIADILHFNDKSKYCNSSVYQGLKFNNVIKLSHSVLNLQMDVAQNFCSSCFICSKLLIFYFQIKDAY